MIFFLDSSAMAKLYVEEAGSAEVRRLVQRKSRIAATRTTFAEVAAALGRAAREGRITNDARDKGLDELREDFGGIEVVEIRRRIVEAVPALIQKWPLRGFDAVQLSAALQLRADGSSLSFWCRDPGLSTAAAGEGLKTQQVG